MFNIQVQLHSCYVPPSHRYTYTRKLYVFISISRSQQHLKHSFCFCLKSYAFSFADILRYSRRLLFVIRSGTQNFCTKSPSHVLRASELNYFYYAHLTVSCLFVCIQILLLLMRQTCNISNAKNIQIKCAQFIYDLGLFIIWPLYIMSTLTMRSTEYFAPYSARLCKGISHITKYQKSESFSH